MTLDLSPGFAIDLDRGPDWLFVRLHYDNELGSEGPDLAGPLWDLMQQHFAHRIVLELDRVVLLTSPLIGELIRLQKMVDSHDGLMRLCGLSHNNQRVLKTMRVADRFPHYPTREAALMTDRPTQPR